MSDIRIKLFDKQKQIYKDQNRLIGAFAGKRGGKSQIGSLKSIQWQEAKPNKIQDDVDPYLGVICAPTLGMLRRLSWKKFLLFASPFIDNLERDINKTHYEIKWHDGSEIIGMSADKPERLEGIKASWIWLDEVFQMSEQFFLECMARVADTEGYIICTGSLGVQYINPKLHWAYQYFKAAPDDDTSCYEWSTADNPHVPRKELQRLKDRLDPKTYRAMFEISWDFTPKSAVYDDFNEDNIVDNYIYRPEWPTYVAIDWGWAHEMAVGFFQYDARNDIVYLFDEIVSSRLKLETLYKKLVAKPYDIDGWYCDIAGNQEREQTARSNVQWFRERGIIFKYKKKSVQYGVSLVRSYVKDGKGRRRFRISKSCRKCVDGMKQYKYVEKNGIIQNENPLKKDDDAVDMIRYYFMNRHDKTLSRAGVTTSRIR
jgi:PBSX family phage terminase large subunit